MFDLSMMIQAVNGLTQEERLKLKRSGNETVAAINALEAGMTQQCQRMKREQQRQRKTLAVVV